MSKKKSQSKNKLTIHNKYSNHFKIIIKTYQTKLKCPRKSKIIHNNKYCSKFHNISEIYPKKQFEVMN